MTSPSYIRLEKHSIPEPNSGCWIWTGYVNEDGYGRMRGGNGKTMLSHRESYRVHCDEIPLDMQVLHRCDTPSCVNPEHLFLGTVTDNMQDMKRKGRGRSPQRGTSHHFAKLDQIKAFEIRWLAASGEPWNSLAKKYLVAKHNVQCVVKGVTWKPEDHD